MFGGFLTRIRLTTTVLIAALVPLSCHAQFPAAPGTGPGLAETIEAIDGARVTTRILYVTAHPDDESAAVLTYLARGLHADVALLSVTRGEGGQNALGPEQAPQLGLIRTQELLAATRGYGVKLYFTRAQDFGFSKTPEETERIWGDAVIGDMVRVMREFRPNIVINGWGGVHSGHGHHQTAGIWTPQAVKLAGDAKYLVDPNFPVWNNDGQSVKILDVERGGDNPKGYLLPVDDVDPLYGKSYREIGLDAFVNHRTQGIAGFINSPFLRRPVALLPEDGSKLDPRALGEPLAKLLGGEDGETCESHAGACAQLQEADEELREARAAALKLDYAKATQWVVQALQGLEKLTPTRVDALSLTGMQYLTKLYAQSGRLLIAVVKTSGFTLDAEADRGQLALRDSLKATVTYRCRKEVECPFHGPVTISGAGKEFSSTGGDSEHGLQFSVDIDSPPAAPSAIELLRPDAPPLFVASLTLKIDAQHQEPIKFPVVYTYATSTSVSRLPVRLVPAYTLSVEPRQSVEVLSAPHKPFNAFLRVHSYFTKASKISVGLETPDGFTASSPVELSFDGIGDQYAKLTVTPPAQLAAGDYTLTAYAKRGNEQFSTALEPLPTMPAILWSEPAQTVVHAFDITVPPNLRVGYISAEGEMIPEALRRLGISVEMLDANALNFGDLSKYSAIVVGVRAYELRPELASANKRLLDYVANGGTLVVQYNRDYIWNRILPAPYHATIGNPTPRITDENAEVKFLKPDDRLLSWPNKITSPDFQGWVQERGLYYWSDFDSKYTALLSMHDPGENDLTGGLVYTAYGKGSYIYTGLAFFRELPEGVPGAYRLFVNLLSASQSR
jgi:LmbE family N-acetylglucosaminyl deacetylase